MRMVLQVRMERAVDLLLNTGLDLETVAVRVGFATASAFSRAFVRHAGRRPGVFRHQAGLISRSGTIGGSRQTG